MLQIIGLCGLALGVGGMAVGMYFILSRRIGPTPPRRGNPTDIVTGKRLAAIEIEQHNIRELLKTLEQATGHAMDGVTQVAEEVLRLQDLVQDRNES
jgi:hypothetical protein